MAVLLSYILLGVTLSAPMGPINAAQLDKGIRFGFIHAWLIGLGAMIADALMMLMIFFGISNWLDRPFIQTFLFAFGFFVLCYTGIESIVKASAPSPSAEGLAREPRRRSFLSGFLLAISNPLNLLFWLGIYGSMLAQTAENYEGRQLLLYSGAIFIGIMAWDLTMASAAAGARKWVSPAFLQWISIVSGIILIGFGVYFGFQALNQLIS
ncbi:LysE family translocator [Halobacillus litoralis]|uniref:LysE family transporter n=1 Tax=Halobacillus litoralis TaxID=45668 RepID=UPI001CD2F5AB|nr:LysE family transporter [Halobacillus litoralis]MCA0971688.1 LysE family translocator [Halobacillus litoralis]